MFAGTCVCMHVCVCACLYRVHVLCFVCELLLCGLSYAHGPLVQYGARLPMTCVHVCV